MIVPINEIDIVLEKKARGPWCLLPYPNHQKGCPNYGKKDSCPPFAKPFEELIGPPFYLVVVFFDLEAHVTRMKNLHPNWTDKQARCLLYWQGSVKKKLLDEALGFIEANEAKNLFLLRLPEANGVNVFKTCENVGIKIDRNPTKIVRKVMIIGTKK